MTAKIDTINARVDGFSNIAHEFAHCALAWDHSLSGRYCLMNFYMTRDIYCPSHPNPIFKAREGWLDLLPYENTQQVLNLEPIESERKCGIITMYGKPIAAPDGSLGESYFVENRRRIGFDQLIINNLQNPNFLGGLLVWHYSPYKKFIHQEDGYTVEVDMRIITANNEQINFGHAGNIQNFYAHLAEQLPLFYNLLSNRTTSGDNKSSGIELRNIEQIDYNNLYSSMRFNLNYTISEPTVYNQVVYLRAGTSPVRRELSGNVFYHSNDYKEFYKIHPGTLIDICTRVNLGPLLPNIFIYNNMEAKGDPNNLIFFRGPGYSNGTVNFRANYNGGIDISNPQAFMDIDSLILENVKIENMKQSGPEISSSVSASFPMKFKNIQVSSNFSNNMDYDMQFTSSYIPEMDLSDLQILFKSNNNIKNNINLTSSRLTVYGNQLFYGDTKLDLNNSVLDNFFSSNYFSANFRSFNANEFWNGITLNEGGIILKNSSVKNAKTGIEIISSTSNVRIENTDFDNNRDYDLILYKIIYDDGNMPIIKNNDFNQSSSNNVRIASILATECPNVDIDSNRIINSGYFGIISMNNEGPNIRKNTIAGGNINGTYSSGIFSYNSNGYYDCNRISECNNYGITLDNSQPVLFNNVIMVNGIGLYLTNNSNPIMAPGTLPNETYVMGGYNQIRNNASEEIYCNNSDFYNSIPFLYKGENAIEDEYTSEDILIYNREPEIVLAPTIDAPSNYWGGGSPQGRLYPDYSIIYDPYLTEYSLRDCRATSENENNASLAQEYLLLGAALKSQHQENYSNSLNYSQHILSLQNSVINPIISLNNLFTSTLLSNGNFINLQNYYQNQILQHPNDTILVNKLINLSIQSKIASNQLEVAISDYQNIINIHIDEEIRFYAYIDRSRAIRLLLDSLMNLYQGGDNMLENTNVDELYKDAIQYNTKPISNTSKTTYSLRNKINRDQNKEEEIILSDAEISLSKLQKNVSDKIQNINNLDDKERRLLMIEKNILDLTINNYVDGIASLDSKLKYLSQEPTASKVYKLNQNYPNPFNPVTSISYEIPKEGLVKINVYDITGKEVATLLNEFKNAGSYSITFNGSNLASGVYFYKIETGNFTEVKRMLLVK